MFNRFFDPIKATLFSNILQLGVVEGDRCMRLVLADFAKNGEENSLVFTDVRGSEVTLKLDKYRRLQIAFGEKLMNPVFARICDFHKAPIGEFVKGGAMLIMLQDFFEKGDGIFLIFAEDDIDRLFIISLDHGLQFGTCIGNIQHIKAFPNLV